MESAPQLWEFLPLSEHAAPSERSGPVARGRLRRLRRFLREHLPGGRPQAEEPSELDLPDAQLLELLIPAVDVEAGSAALASALGDWPADPGAAGGARTVVGPPGSGVQEMVAALGRERGWPEVEPPDRAELVDGGDRTSVGLEAAGNAGQPVVVARLEHWLLRTATGLPVVRRLLHELHTRRVPALMGCDSWSWAFLCRAMAVDDLLGEPLVPRAFDGAALDRWLGAPFRSRRLDCRQAANREPVFSAPGPAAPGAAAPEAGAQPAPVSALLDSLAVASRGIPVVAAAMWRRGLRSRADQTAPPPGTGEQESGWTLWVRGTEEMEVRPPAGLDRLDRFVLHALLLHGGLAVTTLGGVLPFPEDDVRGRLRKLAAAGVVGEQEGIWTVEPAAYGPVRRLLAVEQMLVDDL